MAESKINITRLLITAGVIVVIFVGIVLYTRPKMPSTNMVSVDARLDVYKQLSKGKQLAGDGKHDEAIAVFDQLAQNEAGTRYGWNAEIFAARSMGRQGQHEAALERLDRIIAECPLDDQIPVAQVITADVTSLAGRHDEAIHMLDPLVDEFANQHPTSSAKALFTINRIHERQSHHGLKWATLERISEEYPGPENTHRLAAQLLLADLIELVRDVQADTAKRLKKVRQISALGEGTVTWTADNGPYIIMNKLVVGDGTQLYIEAGTEIRFGIDGQINVKGNMEAVGSEEQPIRFISLEGNPDREWWNGITVTAADATARLSHCQIEGASVAITVESGKAELDHCKIARCGGVSVLVTGNALLQMAHCDVIRSRRVGLRCDDGAVVQIQDCRFNHAKSHGVLLKGAGASTFLRTRIEGSGRNGIRIRGRSEPTIEECVIQDNANHGIECIDEASPKIVASVIANNAGNGIRLQRWKGLIRNSEITGNQEGGIYADARCQGKIDGNTIRENELFGVHLRLACSTAITNNQIAANGTGLWLQQGSVPLEMSNNHFVANTNAALRNESNTAVKAGSNWWGTTNLDQIAKLVQDQQDNPDWGPVTLDPLLEQASTQ